MTTTNRLLDLLRLTAIVAIEIVAIAALHRLGQEPWAAIDLASPLAWTSATAPADAVAALARVAALGLAWALLMSTLVAVLAALTDVPVLVRLAARTAPRLLRDLARRGTALAVVGGIIAGVAPAQAAPLPPGIGPRVETADSEAPAADPTPPVESDRPEDRRRPLLLPPGPAPATEPPAPTQPAAVPDDRHIVATGEHLWSIAAETLAHRQQTTVAELDARSIAGYWLKVVDANRDLLRSGDPDLIHPGETIVLPR